MCVQVGLPCNDACKPSCHLPNDKGNQTDVLSGAVLSPPHRPGFVLMKIHIENLRCGTTTLLYRRALRALLSLCVRTEPRTTLQYIHYTASAHFASIALTQSLSVCACELYFAHGVRVHECSATAEALAIFPTRTPPRTIRLNSRRSEGILRTCLMGAR